MATGQTPTYLLPYPLSTDPVDVHGDIFELADRLEDVLGGLSGLPSQSGNSGKFLTTNGSSASWATISASAATPTAIGTIFGRTNLESGVDPDYTLGQYVNVGIGHNSLLNAVATVTLTEDNLGIYVETGVYNTAVGVDALKALTTGNHNTAFGFLTLTNETTGNDNVGIGSWSLYSLTDGSSNIAIGSRASVELTTGDANTAIGTAALENATTASDNVAIGVNALQNISDNINNVAVGSDSGKYVDGNGGVFLGAYAGNGHVGDNNIAIGVDAMYYADEPLSLGTTNNIGIGSESMWYLEEGIDNIAIGYRAGNEDGAAPLITGSNNIIIGAHASSSADTIDNEITFGNNDNSRIRIPGMEIDWQYVLSEETTIVGAAPDSTTNYELMSDRSVRYHTVNATTNWILNLRGNDVTAYDDISNIGKSTTIVFMATNGATAYYPTAFRIDGTNRTVKWQGGTAPSAGNANSIDVYAYTIIKTGVDTYTVLGSQTKFA